MNALIRCLITLWLCLSCGTANPEARSQDAGLVAVMEAAKPDKIPREKWNEAIEKGLWNPEQTALAISIPGQEGTVLFVFLKQADGTFVASDASVVELANFGKLGFKRSTYDRCETTPVKWMPRDDGYFQVLLRTRAWRKGQRYTASELQVIGADGKIFMR